MPEDKKDMYKQIGEELRLQNQKRQAAQQEASDKLNQRVQQAYQGWSEVPEGLCTKTQLKREGLRIPEGAEPVAEVYVYRPGQRRHPFYDLYRREDAVARDPKATIDPYNYEELAQLWHEFTTLGPPIDQATFHPIDFCEWLNTDDDTPYGLPDVVRFLDEKEHREGTALKSQEQGVTTMATYEERRDKRFHEHTVAALKDIEERAMPLPQEQRYAAAYGILRGYVESLLVNFAESFREDQLAEIRIVLDQLTKLVREDEHVDEATRNKLDQLAQSLRESDARDADFHLPEHDPDRDQEQQSKQEYTLYRHPSEMYTARMAYDNDIPLWGSERLELFHDGRWVDGKVGHVGAASGLVLWPRENAGNPEYIVLTIGSLVRNVSEPVGDGTGPEAFNREQAIKHFTELSRRIRTDAYAEREPDSSYAERKPDGSYGADGIDESIDTIINAAAQEGLAFVYQEEGDTYTLEPVPLEADEPPDDEEDGPELRQCPYCYELHDIEHIELCLLNPKRI